MKRLVFVIFLAGCPDPDGTTMPVSDPLNPPDPCVGFGVTFSAQSYGDASYFGYSHTWAGAVGDRVKPVAVGGVEYVSVYGPPYVDATTPTFDAAVNGPAIAIDPDHVPSANRPAAVLGMSDGVADLCVYDHGSTVLHDGVRMVARSVESVIAQPSAQYFQPFERQPTGTSYPLADWRMFIGKRRTVTLGLIGADDWRLVDQGMTIDLAVDDDSFTPAIPEAWDSVSRDIDHATTLRIRATRRNGEEWQSSVGFVDHVDTIAMLPSSWPALDSLRLDGGWTSACFTSTVDGVPVIAAPYVFSATPQVALHLDPHPSSCVDLEPIASGSGALSVVVGATALEVPFTILPAGS